jgi:DNA-directed RNA polymerase subunit RPC12/RpoP
MANFKFECPHCAQKLEAPDDMHGETIDCPACKGRIDLPKPISRPLKPLYVSQKSSTMPQPRIIPIRKPPDLKVKRSSAALASLVLGIASFAICLGPFAAIPAIICGHLGFKRIKQAKGAVKGEGLAIAGLVLGYLNMLVIVWLVLQVVNHMRAQPIKDCVMNLTVIEGCKVQLVSDYGLAEGSEVTPALWWKYETKESFVCPSGGHYDLGRIGEPASCSIEEHNKWHQRAWPTYWKIWKETDEKRRIPVPPDDPLAPSAETDDPFAPGGVAGESDETPSGGIPSTDSLAKPEQKDGFAPQAEGLGGVPLVPSESLIEAEKRYLSARDRYYQFEDERISALEREIEEKRMARLAPFLGASGEAMSPKEIRARKK